MKKELIISYKYIDKMFREKFQSFIFKYTSIEKWEIKQESVEECILTAVKDDIFNKNIVIDCWAITNIWEIEQKIDEFDLVPSKIKEVYLECLSNNTLSN